MAMPSINFSGQSAQAGAGAPLLVKPMARKADGNDNKHKEKSVVKQLVLTGNDCPSEVSATVRIHSVESAEEVNLNRFLKVNEIFHLVVRLSCKVLKLNNTEISSLALIGECATIMSLSLRSCDLLFSSENPLKPLHQLPKLEEVDLQFNQVLKVVHFVDLLQCKALRRVDLRNWRSRPVDGSLEKFIIDANKQAPLIKFELSPKQNNDDKDNKVDS